jgi:hypothetical protein
MQGSIRVIEELMKFDRQGVISARNRITEATPLQLAAEGGHAEVVKALVRAGASCTDENKVRTDCFVCWDQMLVHKGLVYYVDCGLSVLHVPMNKMYRGYVIERDRLLFGKEFIYFVSCGLRYVN